MSRTVPIALTISLLWLSACASGRDTSHHEADVKATLEAFYGAMKTGDTATAMKHIAEDAMFVESGRLETREQYEKNHFPNDFAFEKQITGTRTPWRTVIKGDTAWAIASTTYKGPVDGEHVNFVSSQLAVLTNETDGWRIRSIHWSSRPNLD
jgi:ketosteroid isomerase-like protein